MVEIVSKIEDAEGVTHSGTMHADEVFATAFLDLYKGNIKVFRTNNVDGVMSDDVLVYDIGRGKFDHHQLDALKRDNGIPYSSFGLLWKEFGRDYINSIGIEEVEDVFLGVDKDFIEAVDGDDNGIFPKIECNYKVKTISNLIKIFNPSYDSNETESEQFLKAVEVAKRIFQEEVIYVHGKVIANKKVEDILDKWDMNKKYLLLDEYIPYEETLLEHEEANEILFVAFPSNRGGFAIKTVPKSSEDKTARCEFPLEWAGLNDEKLEEVSGIEGLKFCHTGRFIVSCRDINCVYQVLDKLCQ